MGIREESVPNLNTLGRFMLWVKVMSILAGGMAITILDVGRWVGVTGHGQQHNNCDLKALLFALFMVGILTFSYVLFPKSRTT